METLSHKFLEALAAPRDRLYALARAQSGGEAGGGGEGNAEALLQKAAGAVFHEFAQDSLLDIPAAMEEALTGGKPPAAGAAEPPPPMPADVWARLAAAVQLEASRSNHAQALHPDSVLLRPDPMLAPKKGRPRAEPREFDVSSPGRLFLFLGAAVLAGAALTVYVVTRPPGRAPGPASRPATATAPSSMASAASRPGAAASTPALREAP